MTQRTIDIIIALAKKECLNYKRGKCRLTDKQCLLIDYDRESIRAADDFPCHYVLDCLLPADWDLDDLVAYARWWKNGSIP